MRNIFSILLLTPLALACVQVGHAEPMADTKPGPTVAATRPVSLAELDRLVALNNRALVAAQRATQSAQAGQDMAAARPNPTVSLNTSGYRISRPTGTGSLDSIVRIDQPFERGNKRDLRIAVSDALVSASRLDEADVLRQVRLFARQSFFDLKAAEEVARLAADSATLTQQTLSKAELRQRAGDLSASEVARIRTDSLKAQADAVQASVDLQRARLQLAQLLAQESMAPQLVTQGPWPAMTALPADQDWNIERRSDIQAALRRVAATEKAVELANALQTRDVTVGAQLERDQTERGNLVGLGVSIPLFTGYDYRGEIRKAWVDRDLARDELERVRATAMAEVAQNRFEVERLCARAQQLQDFALPSARQAFAAVQLAFTHGAASALDVIEARRSLYSTETDTAKALADAAKARAAWAAALELQDMP